MKKRNISFESLCIHDISDDKNKSHQLPIYATSSFEFDTLKEGIDVFTGEKEGYLYSRYSNPTINAVENKIACLEGYDLDVEPFGIMTSSGMAAISTLCFALCSSGDSIITQEDLYGGTTQYFEKVMAKYGINIIYTDLNDNDTLYKIIEKTPKTKLIYIETPSNPTLTCIDLRALSKIAQHHKIQTIVDNTFCTPYIQRPLSMGIDYVIHSTTKFINGHGNGISGIIVGKDKVSYEEISRAMKLIGTNSNAHDAWFVNNGIKTLSLRMNQHSSNAMELATYLDAHPKVEIVNYLGLSSHNSHQLAKQQMSHFGGMLSFAIRGNIHDASTFVDKLSFCTIAPTLGDVDTLIVHPASMSHMNIPKEIRERNGIPDTLLRASVGIENIDDIIYDINQALS